MAPTVAIQTGMPYLRIFLGDTLLQQRALTTPRTRIGRADDNDIVLEGGGVSKYHAVVEQHGDQYVYVDLQSANGSFIGGRRIDRHTLRYWDEIQVFQYLIKFMAVARAKGEEAGAPSIDERRAQEATMELDIASIGDLARLKRRTALASVVLYGPGDASRRFVLDKVNFTIGKVRGSDIADRGWWAPRVAARIQRRADGFYLQPGWRGRVMLNGRRVSRQARLHDGDRLSVRGMNMRFECRPAEKNE